MSVASQIDAVTFAVIRHKLHQVIDEAMLALENVSGAPNTAEAHDMMVSLYRADGGLMVGGVGFLHHLSSAAEAVKVIVASFSEDPGIDEGDIYMLNDSYVAALHPPDVYIVSPIYFGGVLRGFVANFVHVVDIGAIDPGGFSPNSRNRFHEGFQTKGLKIVERGKARRDVFETFLNQVREPDLVALDIRSQIAANNVAIERMQRLYEEYGPETVDVVSEELIRQSEDLMRGRLRELPDGTWRARQYLDYPDKLHCVQLELRKQGDTLTYDFTGTSEQSLIGINASYWASWGGVLAPLYPLLAWDITWNEGIFRPVSLVAPEGSLVNCARPGPVSVATVALIKVCNNLSNLLLGKLLDSSPRYHRRSSAVWDGMHCAVILSGKQYEGEGFIVSITDKFAGAGGALGAADGVHIGGELANGVSRWANAETHELHNPVLYLYRNALVDSGGPGEYRGGVTHEFAIVPHKAFGGGMECGLTMKGLGIPMSLGLSGGYPGSNASGAIVRQANVDELPDSRGAMRGEVEVAQWGQFLVGERDILYQHYMGGGGYGDPIAREPERVAADVRLGVVSPESARELYGVALGPDGEADEGRTRALRAELRNVRIGQPVAESAAQRAEVPPTGKRINANLQLAAGGYQCTWCGGVFGDPGAPWKLAAARRAVPPTAAGPNRESLEGLELRQYFCPSCASLLETEVAFSHDPPVHDEIERWPEP